MRIESPTDLPNRVNVLMDTWTEYQRILVLQEAYDSYVKALYLSCVGRMMPIEVNIVVPMPTEELMPTARQIIERLREAGTVNVEEARAQLIIFGMVSHPELDGYVLSADHLPMIAGAPCKRQARQVKQEEEIREQAQRDDGC